MEDKEKGERALEAALSSANLKNEVISAVSTLFCRYMQSISLPKDMTELIPMALNTAWWNVADTFPKWLISA